MKTFFYPFLLTGVSLIMACSSTEVPFEGETPVAVLRSSPFSKGVNFPVWFEPFSAGGIQFSRYTEQDFIDVKSLGADVIRLPIRMHSMTGGPPLHALDPLLLKFLDIAVDWAEKHELYIILDNHSFDPVAPTEENIDLVLLPVWEQIARRYKDRSSYVIYEVLNEPHGISDARWGEIQGKAIEAIRRIDPERIIIVGGTDYNSIGKLRAMPKYSDPNLVYTFHFYDPFLFTHQGATWGEPSMASLSGVPFPADAKRKPKIPNNLKGTWVEGALRNYEQDASLAKLRSTLDRVVSFSRDRDVPVFCGEFGVYMINSPPDDRIKWYRIVTEMLDKRNISRTSWDYYGGFGIFNTPSSRDFNSDLNTGVVRAMGFTPPPQKPRPTEPLDAGFVIYDDYLARNFSVGHWSETSVFDMYAVPAAEGEYAIRWGNADQYNFFWISFDYNGDFSKLAASGYCLEFQAKANQSVRFDIRFVNPESQSSIPWRMRHSIDESRLPPDGQWHTVRIPLKDMQEHGAWIDSKQEWLTPQGKFSWKQVKQLEFVAEDGALKDRYIWFDNIKIAAF